MSGTTHEINVTSICDSDGRGRVIIAFPDLRKSTAKNAEAALAREIRRIQEDHVRGDIQATLTAGHRFRTEWVYELGPAMHPEQALFQAGASDGHCYEIVGASYESADRADGSPEAATIDLGTADQTGCLLTHDYGTGATALKWDGGELYGTDEDVQTAIEDITGGRLNHQALFAAFRLQMTAPTVTR